MINKQALSLIESQNYKLKLPNANKNEKPYVYKNMWYFTLSTLGEIWSQVLMEKHRNGSSLFYQSVTDGVQWVSRAVGHKVERG